MGQINRLMRRVEGGFGHWCPGCEKMHVITSLWTFDGNLDAPTFSPSVRITGKQTIKNNGRWAGWVRDADGNPLDLCCHYFVRAGQIEFCPDSTHRLAGQTVPLPELPRYLRDLPREFDVDIVETTCADDGMRATADFSVDAQEVCEARHR